MEKTKILIVEDELIVSTSMELTLTRKGYECSIVASGEEAIAVVNDFDPHIILMDIGLAGKIDGISTAGIIRQQFTRPIIFITEQNNQDVFKQALGTSPHNYIDKPYTDADLLKAIEIALCSSSSLIVAESEIPLKQRVSDGIFVFSGSEHTKVLFSDILYLEANGMSTIMYCINAKYKISLSSNNVIKQLGCPAIVKANRSFYVNIHRIAKIKNDEIIVNGKSVPMGKNYKADILSRVKKISQK